MRIGTLPLSEGRPAGGAVTRVAPRHRGAVARCPTVETTAQVTTLVVLAVNGVAGLVGAVRW